VPHKLAIIVPFRDDGGNDPLAQGIGREQNLNDFTRHMCNFVKVPMDIYVVEQEQGTTWNKGKLFNIGYHLTKRDHDYMVLHDVDQVPEKKENNYSWKEKPTLLLSATSQWNYKRKNPDVVGGALQISHVDYAVVGGYSNVFEGWGREDDNMAYRLKKHMGYDVLASSIGRYTELTHQRVWGLDETEQFRRNNANVHDLSNGVDRVQFAIKKWDNTSCSDTMIYRAWVQTMPNKSVQ
jgi:hypothetical protein